MGETPITANDPYEPSSYLTCMLGAPFDGLRCKIKVMMSNHKMLVLEAHTSNDTNTTLKANFCQPPTITNPELRT